jgi:serine/threonine protein kinase
MHNTTFLTGARTLTFGGQEAQRCPQELLQRYEELISEQRLTRTEHLRFQRLLGAGGQGTVFLTDRRGSDHFTLPVAVKVFSPEPFADMRSYEEAMQRIAHVAGRVALIQQDNLLDVQNFVERNRIRIMEMEWIDGFDLSRLLSPAMYKRTRDRVSEKRWAHLNEIMITAGPKQSRLKPGIAIAILRECLAGLAALHREGIVHGDMKPSNIMVKRTGNAKLIDIGSAFDVENAPASRTCTPAYAAPEVLENNGATPRSDLCSLGYVLIEMLSGVPCFEGYRDNAELLYMKRVLPQRLADRLPRDVVVNDLLMNLIRSLIATDPNCRFADAETADLKKENGAASFHRQLIKGDLATAYEHEIRLWLGELD